jgi:hypothetical protein
MPVPGMDLARFLDEQIRNLRHYLSVPAGRHLALS